MRYSQPNMDGFEVNVDGQKKPTSGPVSKKFIHSPFFVNCEAQQGVLMENVKEVLVEMDKENPNMPGNLYILLGDETLELTIKQVENMR